MTSAKTPSGRMIDVSIAQKQGREPIPSEQRFSQLIDRHRRQRSDNSRHEFSVSREHVYSTQAHGGGLRTRQDCIELERQVICISERQHICGRRYRVRSYVSRRQIILNWTDISLRCVLATKDLRRSNERQMSFNAAS